VYLSGLGTMGLEMYEQVPKLDAVIFPAGGHCGLLAGSAAALKHLNPRISVIVSLLSPRKSCKFWQLLPQILFPKALEYSDLLARTVCAGDGYALWPWPFLVGWT